MTAGKNRGASMLFVLAALIVVGFLGTAMVKMSSSDSVNTINYHASASARSAAKSGIISAVHYFESGDSEVITLLQAWVNCPNKNSLADTLRWIHGSAAHYKSLTGEPMKRGIPGFKVELLAFDTTYFNITLKSYGVGKAGSRAEMTMVYNLDGLGYNSIQGSDWSQEDALYLEDDINIDFFGPIRINGHTRLSSRVNFDSWATGSIFNGNFRSQESDLTMPFMGEFFFLGNSYFGTRPHWQRIDGIYHAQDGPGEIHRIFPGVSSFAGKSGFPKGALYQDGHQYSKNPKVENIKRVETVINDASYWLSAPAMKVASNDTYISYTKGTVFHDGHHMNGKVGLKGKGEPTAYDGLTKEVILEKLGMPQTTCRIKVHPEVIPPELITDVNSVDFPSVETINAGSYPEWNGFVVFRVPSGVKAAVYNSSVRLQKKVIVLVEGEIYAPSTSGGKVFSVDVVRQGGTIVPEASGHFTVIVRSGGVVANWGGWEEMRGLYYRMSGGRMEVGGEGNFGVGNLWGAVYAQRNSNVTVSDAIPWYPMVKYDGSPGDITFDASVYEELDIMGNSVNGNANFLTKEGCNDDIQENSISDLVQTAAVLTATLVSQHF